MDPEEVPLERVAVDYTENHCQLIDRERLPDDDLFDDVEPFDVDLGLALRKRGLTTMMEPRSVTTYVPPPPWEVRDIRPFKFRWDSAGWAARNQMFMQKWGVTYDASAKLVDYRRQYLKLGLACWFPCKCTVALANTVVAMIRLYRSRSFRHTRGISR
jgi:hypothetical protein